MAQQKGSAPTKEKTIKPEGLIIINETMVDANLHKELIKIFPEALIVLVQGDVRSAIGFYEGK